MTNEASESNESWKAPYLSYETLTNFFEKKLGGNPTPPRIDTHFLDNYAGSVRPLLIATLKTIGMLDDKNEVLEPMRVAARSADSRKAVLRAWAQDFYREQLELADRHATAQMLWESFSKRGFNGSTLRRAVLFYLALVQDVDLPNSTFFKAPKAPASTSPRGRRQSEDKPPPGDQHQDEQPVVRKPGAGEQRIIHLGDAGTVTVNVDVRWLDLPDDTFTKLRQLIRELASLEPADQSSDEEGGVTP